MKFYIPISFQSAKLSEKVATTFEVTSNPDHDFDYIITMAEADTSPIATFAAVKGVPFPDVSFCSKNGLRARCLEAEVATPESVELSLSAVENCVYRYFIIKPKNGTGGKSENPAVYKIFNNEDRLTVLAYLKDTPNLSDYLLQRAYINPQTRETKLVFVDGAVNGKGELFFNPIADKVMLDSSTVEGHITHKVGVRPLDFSDRYGFKANVSKLLAHHNIKNTLFKAQAIVDESTGTCLINDWSWGVMPYTHVNILGADYLCSQLAFAYDVEETVTKPIDTVICMKHLAMPDALKGLDTVSFDNAVKLYEQEYKVNRVEPIVQAIKSSGSTWFCLYGTTCNSIEDGEARLNAFEQSITGVQI